MTLGDRTSTINRNNVHSISIQLCSTRSIEFSDIFDTKKEKEEEEDEGKKTMTFTMSIHLSRSLTTDGQVNTNITWERERQTSVSTTKEDILC